MIANLTKENFDETLEKHEIIVIDFWAKWCGPCKEFFPVLEEAAKLHPDVFFAKIDIEHETELAADFSIVSIPSLMFIRNRTIVFAQSGVLPLSALCDLIVQAKEL